MSWAETIVGSLIGVAGGAVTALGVMYRTRNADRAKQRELFDQERAAVRKDLCFQVGWELSRTITEMHVAAFRKETTEFGTLRIKVALLVRRMKVALGPDDPGFGDGLVRFGLWLRNALNVAPHEVSKSGITSAAANLILLWFEDGFDKQKGLAELADMTGRLKVMASK